MSSQGVWEIWSVIEPGCGSAVADCCDFFTRSAWVLVMIKPHANLCPLNQSVDSMSPNTWEHFSSGKWRVAFCLTWFRLMDCSWYFGRPVQALALLVDMHAKIHRRIADVFSCLLRVFERYGLWLNQVVAVLPQIVLTFWKKCLSACGDQTTC